MDMMINARDIHGALYIKHRFRDWMKNRIKDFKLVDGVDYRQVKKPSTGGRPASDYLITKDVASLIRQRDKLNSRVLRHNRKEIIFIEMIEPILKESELVNRILYQYPVSNYRIDIYLPEYSLAVEYDEKHHNYEKDKIREDEIRKEIKDIRFVRVKEGTELESIGLIIKKLIAPLFINQVEKEITS